jgi:hypothetical protein
MFYFQQRTNMEANKAGNWLGVIAISNCKTMWLAYENQVIDCMTRNREKIEAHLASGISHTQAHSKK